MQLQSHSSQVSRDSCVAICLCVLLDPFLLVLGDYELDNMVLWHV